MPQQQKQIFMIVLLSVILVVGIAWALYYSLYGEAADQRRERVLQNIEESNQDFLNILENNRTVLDTLSTTTPTTTAPVIPGGIPATTTATSSDPLVPTL